MAGEQCGKTADGFRRHAFATRVARAQRQREALERAASGGPSLEGPSEGPAEKGLTED